MRRTLFALALAVSACSAPYDPPQFQFDPEITKAAHFVGVSDVVKAGKEFRQPPTRIVMSHGMCSGKIPADKQMQPGSWLDLRTRQITAQLDPDAKIGAVVHQGYGVLEGGLGHAVSRFDVPVTSPSGDAILTFLAWGHSVNYARKALTFEHGKEPAFKDGGPPKRALVNAALKQELMDRCLVDAVVYLGEAGNPIRNGMPASPR